MSADSSKQLAFTAPRNSELIAARVQQEAAETAARKKAEAFDAMKTAFSELLNELDGEAFHSVGTAKAELLFSKAGTARAALALAAACK